MLLSALITKVRRTLQDVTPRRWTDVELEGYTNEGLIDIARKTLHNREDIEISILSSQATYTLPKKAMRLPSVDTAQDYNITNNNTITFTDPKDETVKVIYYPYPSEVSVSTNSTIPLEDDLIEALKYFILKRAYEKEDSMENFQKATYFNQEYRDILTDMTTRWHNDLEVIPAKNDYYI